MVDPGTRYTARQILAHRWTAGDVPDTPLPEAVTQLRRFNARRKLCAVRASVRVRVLVSSIVAARAEAAGGAASPGGSSPVVSRAAAAAAKRWKK